MKIPGADGRTYEVSHAGRGDDYEVRLAGELVGGFRLEPNDTPTWIAEGAKGRLTSSLLTA